MGSFLPFGGGPSIHKTTQEMCINYYHLVLCGGATAEGMEVGSWRARKVLLVTPGETALNPVTQGKQG